MLVDHHLSGVIVGLTLATRPPDIYRALVEATAFGTRVIIDTFAASGIPVTEFVVAGGPAQGQVRDAGVRGRAAPPAQRDRLRAGPGARLGHPRGGGRGRLPGRARGGRRDGRKRADVYTPDQASADVYDEMYAEYTRLHDYFGRDGNEVHAPAARAA